MNKSSVTYRRQTNVREFLRCLPDLPETAEPRYQKNIAMSHRRGQKRFAVWTQFRKERVE
jgi:hypothetical protein